MVGVTVAFLLRSYSGVQPSSAELKPKTHSKLSTPPSEPIEAEGSQPRVAKPRELNNREFNSRFDLKPTDSIKLSRAIHAVYLVLTETRAQKAVISGYDGTHVRITLPPLGLNEDQLDVLVLSRLSESLGEEKAKSILSDPDGAETILSQLAIDRFDNTVEFAFTKVRGYQPGAAVDPTKEGLYNAERIERSSAQPSAETRISIVNFWLTDAYNYGLGWEALSKVPEGYFREEPIAGFRDAPRGKTAIINESTGMVEVLDSEYPGSVVTLPTPRG